MNFYQLWQEIRYINYNQEPDPEFKLDYADLDVTLKVLRDYCLETGSLDALVKAYTAKLKELEERLTAIKIQITQDTELHRSWIYIIDGVLDNLKQIFKLLPQKITYSIKDEILYFLKHASNWNWNGVPPDLPNMSIIHLMKEINVTLTKMEKTFHFLDFENE